KPRMQVTDPDATRAAVDEIAVGYRHSSAPPCHPGVPSSLEGDRSRVVNVSSMAGLLGVFGSTAYCAARHRGQQVHGGPAPRGGTTGDDRPVGVSGRVRLTTGR